MNSVGAQFVTDDMKQDRLFYDDTCPICRRAVRRLRRKGLDDRLELVPLSRVSEGTPPGLPEKGELKREIHLITADGRILRGAGALTHLYKRRRGGKALTGLYRLPPVRWAVDTLYRLIARHRHWLSRKLGWK